MIFLVETKLEGVSDSLIKSIWWTDSFRYVFSPSEGFLGGLIVVWEVSKFTMHEVCRDSRFLLMSGVWVLEEWKCGMIAVYALCATSEKLVCWYSLTALIESLALLVCCAGDFNMVMSLAERQNCLGDRLGMTALIKFIEEIGLLNFSTFGSKFTWCGGDSKGSCIDRFFVSAGWVERFTDLEQHNLSGAFLIIHRYVYQVV
ncbi:hypothetical protein V6N13_109695 [Hibiscus sabdariffa]